MRHLQISRILGGKLTISSKLQGLRNISGGSLVQPALHTLKYTMVNIKMLKNLRRYQNLSSFGYKMPFIICFSISNTFFLVL